MDFSLWERARDQLLELLFPNQCLGCKTSNTLLCDICLTGLPVADNDLPDVRARFAFASPIVRTGIWKLKYKGVREFAHIFGTHLGEYVLEELPDMADLENFHDPVIIPAPISRERLNTRGFNQAELIAETVARITDLPLLANVVIKVHDTPSQVSQHSRAKRLQNLRGAFAVTDPATVKNKNIILIDDVYTTGATAHEIARVLKAAGAKRVLTYTVAH